ELAAEPRNPMPGAGATHVPAWADTLKRRVASALDTLLLPGRKQGCLLCHELADGKFVAPAVPTNWYPRAYFNHKAHRFVGCDKCHDLSSNTDANMLELPKVANCRDCHNPGGARDTCATCHPFHPPR
ncbi:MAG: cytochrome c3 family protein, partial [Planctomycetota bacterium]|nr:cytochrome c3 family protein [Planctomycetota bacterium]